MTGNQGIEAVLLTGGASRRMSQDKATLRIEGVPLGERIAAALAERAELVTVLGRTPIPGFRFVADQEQFAGPLAALARFQPSLPLVFVASCDLVAFEASVIDDLAAKLGDHQAAVPELDGRSQPLCALYRADAFGILAEVLKAGERRIMQWISRVDVTFVPADELRSPDAVRNVNTPAELEQALFEPKP